MPPQEPGLEDRSTARVVILMIAVFVGGILWMLRTGQQTVLQTHVLATIALVLPAFLLAHADNRFLVPYLVLVWAIAPETRRFVDWTQGEYHPRSLISVAPIAATMALAIPVSRQRIVVPPLLYKALGSSPLPWAMRVSSATFATNCPRSSSSPGRWPPSASCSTPPVVRWTRASETCG